MAKTLSPCVLFQMGVSGKTLDQEDPAVKSQRISKTIRTAHTPISYNKGKDQENKMIVVRFWYVQYMFFW